MPRPKKRGDVTSISVDKDIAERWSRKAQERGRAVIDFTNEQLSMNLERYEKLRLLVPNYTYSIGDDYLHVICHKEKATFSIRAKDSHLFCEEDNSTECFHVIYALATPEGNITIKRPEQK